jgi:hypothetical protein
MKVRPIPDKSDIAFAPGWGESSFLGNMNGSLGNHTPSV